MSELKGTEPSFTEDRLLGGLVIVRRHRKSGGIDTSRVKARIASATAATSLRQRSRAA